MWTRRLVVGAAITETARRDAFAASGWAGRKHERRREPRTSPRRRAQPFGRGFTLIELLVVVAILALLISILLPSLKSARRRTKETLCTTNLRSIYLAQTLWLQDHKRFQPLNNSDPPEGDGTWQYNYLIFDGASRAFNFGPLSSNKQLINEIKLLYCPLQKDPFHSLNTSDNPWPPNDFFDTRAAYARRHHLTGKALSDFKKQIAIFSDIHHVPKVIKSGHQRGLNAVFIDGHATWVSDPGIFTDNELAIPFNELDNPVVEQIWQAIDKRS